MLLPGLPLTNLSGENPEPDLWTFEVETPGVAGATVEGKSPIVMIDYVHPGEYLWCRRQDVFARICGSDGILIEFLHSQTGIQRFKMTLGADFDL